MRKLRRTKRERTIAFRTASMALSQRNQLREQLYKAQEIIKTLTATPEVPVDLPKT